MSIQFACDTLKSTPQNFGRPNCPRCGSALLMAEESEFNLIGRIRHTWSCDECSHEFATSITLWPRQA
jgi:ribosomal protein S27AE